jgi:spore coat protein U-like protein
MRARLLVALLFAAREGIAACTLGTQPVAFGGYNPINGSAVDSVGYVNVNCDGGTPYTIKLSAGGGTFASRRMANGGYILDYNLYTDPNRMVVWGDGISGVTVSGSGTGSTVDHPVYGRIPGGQTGAYIGSYSDTITVTLSF